MRKAAVALAIMFAVITAGCGDSSKPSEMTVLELSKKALEVRLDRTLPLISGEILKVDNLKKVDGILDKDGRYEADITFDLIHLKSDKDLDDMKNKYGVGSPSYMSVMSTSMWIALNFQTHYLAGDTMAKDVPSKVAFVKAEKGWRVDSVVLPRKF